jgi:hypothetical protein
MQAGDMAAAEKDLQLLAKERDPRAQFQLGFYVYVIPIRSCSTLPRRRRCLLDASNEAT